MIKFIKISSLIIFLLFFSISFYFNIISISSNSNNESKIFDVYIENIIPCGGGWLANVTIFSYYNVTPIDWGGLGEYENILYTNITMKIGDKIEEPIILKQYYYFVKNLENGKNYTFIFNINGIEYIKNFTYIKEPIKLEIMAGPIVEWNGEEWIARVELYANSIPKDIDWGNVTLENDEFYVNIIINEWIGEPVEYYIFREEHNYSLGILPEGGYDFWVEVNGIDGVGVPFEVEKVITTIIKVWSTVTDIYTSTKEVTLYENISSTHKTVTLTYTGPIETAIYQTKWYYPTYLSTIITTAEEVVTDVYGIAHYETYLLTIKVKEKTKPSSISTKTIRTFTKEISKEKFDIEQYTIPISLFIFTIFVTIILYFILYKRKSI